MKKSPLFYIVKRMYLKAKITQEELQKTVTKGWITEEEKDEILDEEKQLMG